MVHPSQIQKFHQRMRHVFPLVLLIVLFVIAGTHTKVFQQNTQAPIPTPPPPAPHTTYTSDKLGISFTYLTVVSDRVRFFTREIGNIIYLYYTPRSNQEFSGSDAEFLQQIPGHGYSVEVFQKDPQQSIIDAIKLQFLTGYAETDCFVKPTRYGHPREDESYKTAVISFSRKNIQTREELNALVAKCPKYVTASGVSYFLMDPKHPDKLLFVTIGQSNIPSGVSGYSWDKTIKVLQ
jgi:hypothetical protein